MGRNSLTSPHSAQAAMIGPGPASTGLNPLSLQFPIPPSSQPQPIRGECLMCSETVDFVTFEPCGHRIVCEECCIRMKKCVTCKDSISKKICRNGRTVSSDSTGRNSSGAANPSTERLRYLENKFAEIEETFCCSICMERRRNVAFLCGHGACEACATCLTTCHMCRTPIKQKVNLY